MTDGSTLLQVHMYVEEQEEIPWDTLNVLVADITYGVSRVPIPVVKS